MNFIRNFLSVSMVVLFAMPMPSFANVNAAAGASVMIQQMNDSSGHHNYNTIPKRWKTGECPNGFHKAGIYCVIDQ